LAPKHRIMKMGKIWGSDPGARKRGELGSAEPPQKKTVFFTEKSDRKLAPQSEGEDKEKKESKPLKERWGTVLVGRKSRNKKKKTYVRKRKKEKSPYPTAGSWVAEARFPEDIKEKTGRENRVTLERHPLLGLMRRGLTIGRS